MTEAGEESDMESQLRQVKAELVRKEGDLVLAAEIGKKLLEQNQDWEDRCEQLALDHTKRLEHLEQDKHSLAMRLSAKEEVERSQGAELDSLREALGQEREAGRAGERLEMARAKELQTAAGKAEELETRLEQAALTEEQLRSKIEHQEQLVRDAHNKLSSLEMAPSENDEQVYTLQHQLATIKAEKDMVVMEVKDMSDRCQQLAFTTEAQKQRLQSLQGDLEGREQQVTSYYNLLEKTREEVVELQIQLDAAKMEATDVNKKGNSLFGEVEDRRKEAENRLISIKVQFESVKEQLNMKKQQVHKMRFQIAALLQMGGGRADSSQRERLEQSLAQSRSEVHMLTEKVRGLERCRAGQETGRQFEEYRRHLNETDKPDLVAFLQSKLRLAQAEMEEVRKELQTQQLMQISASDRLMDCERRLYSAEAETDRTRAANMKLLVTLDELKLKLNAKEHGSSKAKVSSGYRERISLRNRDGRPNPADSALAGQTAAEPPEDPESDADRAEDSSQLEPPAEGQIEATAADPNLHFIGSNDEVTLPSADPSGGVAVATEVNVLKPANWDRLVSAVPRNEQHQPLAKKQPAKKSVSISETVSVIDEAGRTEVSHPPGSVSGGMEGEEEEEPGKRRKQDLGGGDSDEGAPGAENRDPKAVGGRPRAGAARHGGKRHHKVVHMKSNQAAECKQQ